ncbi:DUF885 domain-containing protein [Phenylobacterium sp.]|uniref:DUF885 domain-containing protein n=1 Tax=Phenylobacterium sp. TaxID=1871053 RepID=UPI002C125AC7|nr:DUF885 family protein [Phenylobacterium sp.]HLZ74433.1 DUF885 family protein [Phenylobacterium sp.]
MNQLDRRGFLATTAAGALAVASGAHAQPTSGAEAELNKAFDDFFNQTLDHSPEQVTSLGLDKGPRAAAKFKLRDASLAAVEQRKQETAANLARLRKIDRKALTGIAAVNYDSVLYTLEAADEGNRRFQYPTGNSPYVLSQISGAYQGTPDFLDSQHTIATREDCEAYLSRLGEFARVMDQEVEHARHDVALGVIPPDFCIAGALSQMKTLRAPADRSTLVASLARRARAKGIDGDWAGQATQVYEQKVIPALDRQMAYLEGLKGRATHDAGVWRLPDGDAYYALALRTRTTTTMTPAQVHKLGLDVTKELNARAEVLFAKLGMTQGSVADRYRVLFKDPKYLYPNTDEGKGKEVADLNALVQGMQARLPEYFGTLPKTPLEIRRIPKETEASSSTHYTPGSLDGTRPGIYWLNLRDTAEAPFWDMPTTTFHEGIPGHHLQNTLQRQADLPMIRKASGFGAYGEGWALYVEQLAQEMGFYKDHPDWELGYIHDALLRSGRLVTDTGLHALRWSREQASQALSDIDGDPIPLAQQEIERYCVTPGQACTYMVGKVSILRLRDKAQAALGPRFDIRQFHDAVLLSGSMPLTVLEDRVDGYIASQKA